MPQLDAWTPAIQAYLDHLRLAATPSTTIAARRQHLGHLAARVDASPWRLTVEQLIAYAIAQRWARETRRCRRNTFLSFWRWAMLEQLATENPAERLPRVKPASPNPRPAPDDIYRAALERADERGRLMIRLAADAGLRRSEVACVHSRDLIHDEAGWSLNVHGKGDKTRVVPLTDRLARQLSALPSGYAFPGKDDGHLSPRWVGDVVADLLGDGWTMHKLRHRAATRVYNAARGDVFIVQDFLGHSSPVTTRSYVAVPSTAIRRAVLDAAGS